MTTQHMHFEHSDADAAVAGHSSTPGDGETTEQVAAPTTPAATQADKDTAQIDTSLSEPASDDPSQEESRRASHELSPSLSHEQQPEEILTMSAEHMQHEQNHQGDTSPAVNTPAIETTMPSAGQESPAEPAGQQTGLSGTDSLPLTKEEEEIRPFTSFIEEFRQAEARLSASVQQSEAEVFSLLIPAESKSAEHTTETAQEAVPSTQAGEVPSDASGASSLAELLSEMSETFAPPHGSINGVSAGTPAAPASSEEIALAPEAESTKTEETEKGVEQVTSEQEVAAEEQQQETAKPEEPAVSPLLRPGPPPRLRSSRHAGRHYRAYQEAQETETGETGASSTEQEPPTAPVEQPEALSPAPAPSTATAEAAEETEKPRPARKYRFDRPAVASKTATQPAATQPAPQQSRGEEQRVAAQASQSVTQVPAQEGNAD
ncbi:MAG: hypothetical protein IMW89_09470, partial [Ktedonobacteraceae bacterium]|nr:hypothetical protein [Ktedonobacteraceae bacterium]